MKHLWTHELCTIMLTSIVSYKKSMDLRFSSLRSHIFDRYQLWKPYLMWKVFPKVDSGWTHQPHKPSAFTNLSVGAEERRMEYVITNGQYYTNEDVCSSILKHHFTLHSTISYKEIVSFNILFKKSWKKNFVSLQRLLPSIMTKFQ